MADIVGKKIVDIRPMTKQETKDEYWEETMNGPATVLVLDDGTLLYPSQDPEGNGPGAIFGKDKNGSFQLGFTMVGDDSKAEQIKESI